MTASELPSDLAGWLRYIEALHPKTIAMGLERVRTVKERLRLTPGFPLILVGGTNGKGSTCALLESIYHHAGYRVASYSSPHLLRYNERVKIGAMEATDAQLIDAFQAVERARQEVPLTYFEFGTLAAMWCFMQHEVDLAVLEVGLGGRLDAVNVFEPDCAIVTAVGIDHTDFLGSSRDSIGFEKAGIFRHDVPALCGDPQPPVTLLRHAQATGARLGLINRDFRVEARDAAWDFIGTTTLPDLPLPALTGRFQLGNAACALAAIEVMQAKLPVTATQIAAGLEAVRLPGRFQRISRQPAVILDVAHNPHAARVLAENLRAENSGGRTVAVFSMLADKDIAGVIAALAAEVDAWHVFALDHVRAADLARLRQAFDEVVPDARVEIFSCVADALWRACNESRENDRIIAFGSFFTVAEVMRLFPPSVTQSPSTPAR